jgi:hypothetical protein
MENALEALLSIQFVLFSLGILALVFVVRKAVELFAPAFAAKKIWTDFLLVVSPIVFCAIAGFIATKYAYPDGLTATSSRIILGSVAGMLSNLVYRLIKAGIKSKIPAISTSNAGSSGVGLP